MAYQRSLQLNNETPITHFNLGKLYLRMGEEDLAVKEFKRAAELEPIERY